MFDILQGDSHPASTHTLTHEAQISLAKVEQAINEQNIGYFSPDLPLQFLVFPTPFSPTGLLWQLKLCFGSICRLLFLGYCPHILSWLPIFCILAGKLPLGFFAKDPDIIVLPYDASQVQWLIRNNDDWAVNCTSFQGVIDNHYPADKLVQFLHRTPVVFPKRTKPGPIAGAVGPLLMGPPQVWLPSALMEKSHVL